MDKFTIRYYLLLTLLLHYCCYALQEKINEAKTTQFLRKNSLQAYPYPLAPVMPYPIYISPTAEPTVTPERLTIVIIDTFENETGFASTFSPSKQENPT